jgi:hypothetical protein
MKDPKQSSWQLIGYCPWCKEEIWYDWKDQVGASGCICPLHSTARSILKKREEEEDE